jgi:hypothetical protein
MAINASECLLSGEFCLYGDIIFAWLLHILLGIVAIVAILGLRGRRRWWKRVAFQIRCDQWLIGCVEIGAETSEEVLPVIPL